MWHAKSVYSTFLRIPLTVLGTLRPSPCSDPYFWPLFLDQLDHNAVLISNFLFPILIATPWTLPSTGHICFQNPTNISYKIPFHFSLLFQKLNEISNHCLGFVSSRFLHDLPPGILYNLMTDPVVKSFLNTFPIDPTLHQFPILDWINSYLSLLLILTETLILAEAHTINWMNWTLHFLIHPAAQDRNPSYFSLITNSPIPT